MTDSTCILVTGPGHSGTRLMVDILHQHPDVSVPLSILDTARDYLPYTAYCGSILSATPMHQEAYHFDADEMRFYLDGYRRAVDPGKPYFVFKVPYYPLLWLSWLIDYFEQRVILVYMQRPLTKIVQSYLNKGEDRSMFWGDGRQMLHHIKCFPPAYRSQQLAQLDAAASFGDLALHCDALRAAWDAAHPERRFVVVDVERIAQSADDLRHSIEAIGLPAHNIDAMYKLVDPDRLHHRGHRAAPTTWKRLLKQVTPPALWSAGRTLRKRLR